MLKKLKKGVKWIMEKKNELIDNSLAVRVYENTREDVKKLFRSCNKMTAGMLSIGLGLGIGIPLLISGYFENRDSNYI